MLVAFFASLLLAGHNPPLTQQLTLINSLPLTWHGACPYSEHQVAVNKTAITVTFRRLFGRRAQLNPFFDPSIVQILILAAVIIDRSKTAEAAKVLLDFLRTADAAAVIKAKGMEPATP